MVVLTDGYALSGGQCKAAVVKDVERALTVSAAVTPACLAKVVEHSRHRNAIGRAAFRVREHIIIYLKRVLSQPAVLLVMLVTTASEVVGILQVDDNGLNAGAPRGAKDLQDPVFSLCHSRIVLNRIYECKGKIFHSTTFFLKTGNIFPVPPYLLINKFYYEERFRKIRLA